MAAGSRKGSAETRRGTVAPDEELKRTLERDTAVQGEREEDAAQTARKPAGADGAPPTARPTPVRRDDRSK